MLIRCGQPEDDFKVASLLNVSIVYKMHSYMNSYAFTSTATETAKKGQTVFGVIIISTVNRTSLLKQCYQEDSQVLFELKSKSKISLEHSCA